MPLGMGFFKIFREECAKHSTLYELGDFEFC